MIFSDSILITPTSLILLIRLRLRVLDDGLAIAAVKAEFDTWRTYGHVQDNPALHELDCNLDY